jgi:transposase InsO family protein
MTETPNKSNEQVIKKPLFSYERIRCLKPKIRPVNAGKEPPKKKPSKSRLAECEEILGTRCRKREPSGWDIRTIGKKGTPAEILRGRAYYDQEFRGFKNPGVTAELLGVSLSFVKKWTQIGKAAKDSGQSIRNAFRSLPTKRVNAPREPSAEQIRTVIEIRKNNPLLGSKKIAVLMPEGIRLSEYAIAKVLRKHKLIPSRGKYHKRKYVRFESPFPMHTIQLDYKTWENGTHSIWALDDHSRAILGYRVVETATAEAVIDLMEEVIRMYGIPIRILTDHGCQFTTMHEHGTHMFDDWCAEKKITHMMGSIAHPQTQGKIERSHGTAIIEASYFGPTGTAEEWSSTIGLWISYYNNRRPHMSLDYEFPMKVFDKNIIERGSEEWLKAFEDPWVTAYA